MKRDLNALSNNEYDLVVIGGGIYGAALAWEAASRGLSVALLEKSDFAAATSANSLKTIHGGFRYLQHLDFLRMRQSMVERKALMRIAPHLVHPLPVLVPVYGHGFKGREMLTIARFINDGLSFDRNRIEDPQKRIPGGRMMSRAECLATVPGIEPRGLTGGAVFFDAQVYNSERLVLAFVQAAIQAGAQAANYAEVFGFIQQNGRVEGVKVRDALTGERFEVRARRVANTAGPWIDRLVNQARRRPQEPAPLAKAVNLVIRKVVDTYAVGLMGENGYADNSSLIKKGASLLFVSPWRGHSILGTSYEPYTGDPDRVAVERSDIEDLLAGINSAFPPAQLRLEDVGFVHVGLLPAKPQTSPENPVRLTRHYQIREHSQEGLAGLYSVTGVKYTTARQVSEQVVDRCLRDLEKPLAPSVSAVTTLPGGQIERFEPFLAELLARRPCGLQEEQVRTLAYNYGSEVGRVLRYFDQGLSRPDSLDQALWRAQIRHAVREEMACTLKDVIFRRTDLGTARRPQPDTVEFSARVMAEELGWSEDRTQREIETVDSVFQWQR